MAERNVQRAAGNGPAAGAGAGIGGGIMRANLLVIKGVTSSDFLNTPTAQIVMQAMPLAPQPVKPPQPLNSISNKFTGVANWPKTSNLLCHRCTLPFDDYPKFIALNPSKDSDGNDICDTEGNFCTWNCAAGGIDAKYGENQRSDLHWNLCTFESKFTGRRREKIMPSPSPQLMREFIGEKGLTREQYRERIAEIDRDYDLTTYKMEHYARAIGA